MKVILFILWLVAGLMLVTVLYFFIQWVYLKIYFRWIAPRKVKRMAKKYNITDPETGNSL